MCWLLKALRPCMRPPTPPCLPWSFWPPLFLLLPSLLGLTPCFCCCCCCCCWLLLPLWPWLPLPFCCDHSSACLPPLVSFLIKVSESTSPVTETLWLST